MRSQAFCVCMCGVWVWGGGGGHAHRAGQQLPPFHRRILSLSSMPHLLAHLPVVAEVQAAAGQRMALHLHLARRGAARAAWHGGRGRNVGGAQVRGWSQGSQEWWTAVDGNTRSQPHPPDSPRSGPWGAAPPPPTPPWVVWAGADPAPCRPCAWAAGRARGPRTLVSGARGGMGQAQRQSRAPRQMGSPGGRWGCGTGGGRVEAQPTPALPTPKALAFWPGQASPPARSSSTRLARCGPGHARVVARRAPGRVHGCRAWGPRQFACRPGHPCSALRSPQNEVCGRGPRPAPTCRSRYASSEPRNSS